MSLTAQIKAIFTLLLIPFMMTSCIFEDLKECEGDFYGIITVVNNWEKPRMPIRKEWLISFSLLMDLSHGDLTYRGKRGRNQDPGR